MVVDKEITDIVLKDPFTVSYPGDTKELNSNVFYKPRPGAKTQADSLYSGPQALPKDVSKCAHYELSGLPEDTKMYRCSNRIHRGMPNGFLCQDHHTKLFSKGVPSQVRFNNGDTSLIESILKSEGELISQGHKEKVRLTAKGEFITYLSKE